MKVVFCAIGGIEPPYLIDSVSLSRVITYSSKRTGLTIPQPLPIYALNRHINNSNHIANWIILSTHQAILTLSFKRTLLSETPIILNEILPSRIKFHIIVYCHLLDNITSQIFSILCNQDSNRLIYNIQESNLQSPLSSI